jgi:hypothetical protein
MRQVFSSRAKTKGVKEAGSVRSSATGATDDAANRRFAAARRLPGSTVRTQPDLRKGGSRGLIQNSEDLCLRPLHAIAKFDAHNGKISDLNPLLRTSCKGKAHRHAKHGRAR